MQGTGGIGLGFRLKMELVFWCHVKTPLKGMDDFVYGAGRVSRLFVGMEEVEMFEGCGTCFL